MMEQGGERVGRGGIYAGGGVDAGPFPGISLARRRENCHLEESDDAK